MGFDQTKADAICERLSQGEPLAQICRSEDMPGVTTVWRWREDHPKFEEAIARARVRGYDIIADECVAIAEDGSHDYITKTNSDGSEYEAFNSEHVQRSKLRIETRLKLLSKWDPKRYGDRTITEHDGKIELTIHDPAKLLLSK